jgi:hypothetical protein
MMGMDKMANNKGVTSMSLFKYILYCILFVFTSNAVAVDFNLPHKEWRLISLPADPPAAENTVEKVFGDDILGVYGTDWVLYEYDSGINQYHELNKTDPVKQGIGYWIIQLSGNDVTLDLPAGSHASAPSIALTSSKNQNPQWNLVGSPFSDARSLDSFSVKVANGNICGDAGCSLDRAKEKQLVHNKVWIYNGQGYEGKGTGDTINPWDGFWIPTLPGASGYDLSLVAMPTSNYISSISASDDSKLLTLQMNGGFVAGSHFAFYIDADNNPNTGYAGKVSSVRGMDYLVQGNGLYKYPENANGWKWERFSTEARMEKASTQATSHVPLRQLTTENTIRYIASVATSDWSQNTYSQAKEYQIASSEFIIGDDQFNINLQKTEQGLEVSSIQVNGNEVLSSPSVLFSLDIMGQNNALSSREGWGSVTVSNTGANAQIVFAQPTRDGLPATLKVTAMIKVKNAKSYWDLQVTGLGGSSLMDTTFPAFNIRAGGNDHFFVPNRFGQVFDNPGSGMPVFSEIYPKGWGATMQYMTYYNGQYGLYFGAHDPKASIKTLKASSNAGSINLSIESPAPNKTLAGNDWDFPGEFELDAYQGDWYDAALLYKDWVYRKADYRPPVNRPERAKRLGNISVWAVQNINADIHYGNGHTREELGNNLEGLRRALSTNSQPVTLGMYWLSIHGADNEHNMPQLYPSNDTQYLVNRFKGQGVLTMLYGNGYLYDLNIANPDETVPAFSEVKKYAAKTIDGSLYTQGWAGHTFAIMCSTQKAWQNILANVHGKYVVPTEPSGIFLDQITASTPVQCYDKSHGHPLGGGHYWRDGYKKLIEGVRSKYSAGTYVISEAVNDSLMDTLDGYEVQNAMYLINNQVPAMQVVYGGKVQFIGPSSSAGSYNPNANSEDLYGMSAYAFALGSTQGYFYAQLPNNSRAVNYVRKLARLREKLKSYISFGEMKRPLILDGGIPETMIHRGAASATISAIQIGAWSTEDKHSIAIVFINAQVPGSTSISFSPNFNAEQYGLHGNLSVKKVTEDGEEVIGGVPAQVTLDAADAVAYIITQN